MSDDEKKKSKAEKRLEAKKKKTRLIFITVAVVIVALIVVGAAAGLVVVMLSSDGGDDDPTGITMTSTEVQIPRSEVNQETVLFLNYDASGLDIHYLVVEGSDGKVRTAFNACDNATCQLGHYGFTQQGTYLKCENLGCTYPINLIGTGRDNCCVPFPLEHSLKNDKVIILRSDLEAGRIYFE